MQAMYPVHLEGRLDPRLSRWLWLVKWLLAIPHYVVLFFLWITFFVLSIVAFFAILFTGRYPRGVFDFNVGVLRWTWRVLFYSYGALGTDRYPPFTLAEVPDYPATLEIDYPERLSRGLVLVKWWLLAIPHYLVVGFFAGGGAWVAWQADEWRFVAGFGLIGVLVLFAAVALLFRGRYPGGIFDFVLGLNRWVVRVWAYTGLMTDAYPPFRLDTGGTEKGLIAVAPAAAPATAEAPPARWSGGRVLVVVLGSIATLLALGVLAAGTAVVVIDQTQRDADGFVMSWTEDLSTPSYALVSESLEGDAQAADWFLGTVRIRVTSDTPVFVGIAPAADAERYLGNVAHAVVADAGWPGAEDYDEQGGGAPPSAPAAQGFWAASTSGSGEQVLDWELQDGSWRVVAMNADASAGVAMDVSVGAELDNLVWYGIGFLVVGGIVLVLGAALIYGAVPKRTR